MFDFDDHFKTVVARDAACMLLGNHIANGTFRSVYEHASDPTQVVKVETGYRSFYNMLEWTTWEAVKALSGYAKWFAPCLQISPSGCVLTMARTAEPRKEEFPRRMPEFLSDFKRENFGLYQGRVVCHDYGHTNLIQRGLSRRMVKVDWD